MNPEKWEGEVCIKTCSRKKLEQVLIHGYLISSALHRDYHSLQTMMTLNNNTLAEINHFSRTPTTLLRDQ